MALAANCVRQGDVRSRDMTISLGYPTVARMTLLAICLAASGPRTEAADFANMAAFQ